jgi:hypothetical protein
VSFVSLVVKDRCSDTMPFDAHALFANLTEKERIKGHHSPEGQAIRVLSRALNGWSSGSLSRRDVAVLCGQAIEDWLNVRLMRSPWSSQSLPVLAPLAVANRLLTQSEADRLLSFHGLRAPTGAAMEISREEVEAALEFCVELIDKHW